MNRKRYIMRGSIILAIATAVCCQQNSRRPELENAHGWDIRLAVPGKPGTDYPILSTIPRTSFSCSGKSPGYYADLEAGCQVFRVCTLGSTYGFQSFLCPNGTLFNQEVLVCDWWMSVRCDRSRLLFSDNRDKFGNLKLGPQLMKDIKNMLTHPMRNPYDKTIMKSNFIVMQDYKPPAGQLFPNGALISGPDRPPSNVYVPAKQRQGNFAENSFYSGDLSFAASTPSSQYIPSNLIRPTNSQLREISKPQIQNLQLIQNGRSGNVPNSYNGQSTQAKITQPVYNQNTNQNQKYNAQQRVHPNTQNLQNFQAQRQTSQYGNKIIPTGQIKKQLELDNNNINNGNSYNYNKPSEELIQKNNIQQSSRILNGNGGREVKQNLMSPNIVPFAGKTLKFSRIVQKSTAGSPKSRITFKTWIVRPSKTARLVAEPTPYSYDKPTNSPQQNRLEDTTTPRIEKVNPESEQVPYVYNKPTPSNKQVLPASPIYLPPPMPTLSNKLYSTPKISQQAKYVAPTTYKPASKLYVPPAEDNFALSRQYLSPDLQSPETNYQNARLVATPTSPSFEYMTVISDNKKNPSFSLTKHSHINTNQNNLTFADILTKEKLDITVSDIVKDTNKILATAPPEVLNQYRQNEEIVENPTDTYVPPEFENVSDEKLTTKSPQTYIKSEKIIATPSSDLEPPIETFYNYENTNKLTNLPFFKEPAGPTNTIERTVSLKITIPEMIAEYLFNNHSGNEPDNLEILNTGSSNYLVLTNNNLDEGNSGGIIPIGKLIWDKNVNFSNSQALVYSFLADSINAAKEYSNIAKQTVKPTPMQLQIQNLNNENLNDITDKISHLTSSQFSTNNQKSANYEILPSKNININDGSNHKYTEDLKQQLPQSQQQNIHSLQQNYPEQLYSSRLRNSIGREENSQRNSKQIYSGQLYKLPVPEVTSRIYNSPASVQSNSRLTNELPQKTSELNTNQNFDPNNDKSNTEVEIVESEALPYPSARLELPRTDESIFNTRDSSANIYADNFLNPDTGITAQVQDKIFGTLPHPLEENKLVTYQKNKSYYLYTKVEDNNEDETHAANTITQATDYGNQQNTKLIRNNDISNHVTFELFPSIGYELEDEREKQRILNALKIKEFSNTNQNGRVENFNQRESNLVSGVDFTILHPSSKTAAEQLNTANTILYRGPSSYFAPQSSVGSLRGNQQVKFNGNARIEQFDDNNNNGYSKVTPARQFTF